MSGRSLRASINHTTVGTLHEVAGLWRFQYAPDWLGTPACFALAAQATQAATTQGLRPSPTPAHWHRPPPARGCR